MATKSEPGPDAPRVVRHVADHGEAGVAGQDRRRADCEDELAAGSRGHFRLRRAGQGEHARVPRFDLRARLRGLRHHAARAVQLHDRARGAPRPWRPRGPSGRAGRASAPARRTGAGQRRARAGSRPVGRGRDASRADPPTARSTRSGIVRGDGEVAQRVLGDAGEERGGHVAALVARAPSGVSSETRTTRAGRRGGHEADEGGHVVDHRVVAARRRPSARCPSCPPPRSRGSAACRPVPFFTTALQDVGEDVHRLAARARAARPPASSPSPRRPPRPRPGARRAASSGSRRWPPRPRPSPSAAR